MITFFADCCGLFTHVFEAAMAVEFFVFIGGFIALTVCYGLFMLLYKGAKKL